MRLYFESVGRGCNLILNVPPDRRGRIHENDARALSEWKKQLDLVFSRDLARGASASSGSTRGGDARFAPANVVDGNHETYWATSDDDRTPELVLALPRPTEFDVIRIREYLPLGQRVERFAVDAWNGYAWEQLAAGTSLGSQRILSIRRIVTSRVRLRILQAPVCPAISELSLFASPNP
jgi:alpha-L-fucosidase